MDPEWTQTRLGDGFYEQPLVLDQITQLTDRLYLGTTPMALRNTGPCSSPAWLLQTSCN
ncbi:hypothetical protein VDS18_15310 [Xanthomonas campestris pv. campestris]|nr:hypothetical protein [Xanthomonas campestris]MEB2187253.1 hypothetical protein [Xanthomonas campestris pv. campestris]